MNECYMTVKKGSLLYKDYFYWIRDLEEARAVFGKVADTFGIETSKFYLAKDRLKIVPTEGDKEKFKKDLMKDGECFRKNSEMSKQWREGVAHLYHMVKPAPTFYIAEYVPKATTRLFEVGDVLYCSIETEYRISIPDWAIPMKASDFYKVLEALEGLECAKKK